jgi:predicted Zn-ribbon and HTH transcriptional regulator
MTASEAMSTVIRNLQESGQLRIVQLARCKSCGFSDVPPLVGKCAYCGSRHLEPVK